MSMTVYHINHSYEIVAPSAISSKVDNNDNLPSLSSAASIIPLDSIPLNLTGLRLVITITFLPIKSSGL